MRCSKYNSGQVCHTVGPRTGEPTCVCVCVCLFVCFFTVAECIIGINILSSWSKRHYDRKGQEEVPETEFFHSWTR